MILVTGANGMVGSYINWKDTIKTDKDTFDVTNKNHLFIYKQIPLTAIVHLAAETDLEFCEREPQRAFEVNTFGTYNVLQLAMEKDIPFVYISTAGIFDGKKPIAYTETDIPNPINVYGASKWCGDLVVKTYPKHYIFRASWMMGGGPEKDKKFVSKIMNKVKQGEKIIYGIGDILGSPTYAKDLIDRVKMALDLKIPYGLYNSANSGWTSRFGVAKKIVEIMGYDVKMEVVSSNFFKATDDKHPCPRSHNEMLDIAKLENIGLGMRPWKDALEEYLQEWK